MAMRDLYQLMEEGGDDIDLEDTLGELVLDLEKHSLLGMFNNVCLKDYL